MVGELQKPSSEREAGASQPLSQLVYVSSATEPLRAEQLSALLRVSRDRNRVKNVTGILIYKDGCFLQVLEGADDILSDTFGRITNDSRHYAIEILRYEFVQNRNFAKWEMAFAGDESPTSDATDSFVAFIDEHLNGPHFDTTASKAQQLLIAFTDDLWRRC